MLVEHPFGAGNRPVSVPSAGLLGHNSKVFVAFHLATLGDTVVYDPEINEGYRVLPF